MPAHPLSSSKQAVLISQILSAIRLSEACNASWVQSSRFLGAPCRNPKAQWRIVHAIDNNTLVFWAVFRPTSNMCLHNITTVQERHFAIRLDPDLVARVLGDDWEGGNMETKFACLGELAFVGVSCWIVPMFRYAIKGFQFEAWAYSHRDIPKHVPKLKSLSLEIEVARFASDRRT